MLYLEPRAPFPGPRSRPSYTPSALFPVGSALPLSTAGCVTGESGGSPCVHFLSAQRMAGTQGATEPCFLSSCGCKGPHTCMTSASLTEPAPQALPHTLFYSEKCFLILPLPSLPLFDFVCFCFVNGFFSVFFALFSSSFLPMLFYLTLLLHYFFFPLVPLLSIFSLLFPFFLLVSNISISFLLLSYGHWRKRSQA